MPRALVAFLRWLPSTDYNLINSPFLMCEHRTPSGKNPPELPNGFAYLLPCLYSQRLASAPASPRLVIIAHFHTCSCREAESLKDGSCLLFTCVFQYLEPCRRAEMSTWADGSLLLEVLLGGGETFITLQKTPHNPMPVLLTKKRQYTIQFHVGLPHGRMWK